MTLKGHCTLFQNTETLNLEELGLQEELTVSLLWGEFFYSLICLLTTLCLLTCAADGGARYGSGATTCFSASSYSPSSHCHSAVCCCRTTAVSGSLACITRLVSLRCIWRVECGSRTKRYRFWWQCGSKTSFKCICISQTVLNRFYLPAGSTGLGRCLSCPSISVYQYLWTCPVMFVFTADVKLEYFIAVLEYFFVAEFNSVFVPVVK